MAAKEVRGVEVRGSRVVGEGFEDVEEMGRLGFLGGAGRIQCWDETLKIRERGRVLGTRRVCFPLGGVLILRRSPLFVRGVAAGFLVVDSPEERYDNRVFEARLGNGRIAKEMEDVSTLEDGELAWVELGVALCEFERELAILVSLANKNKRRRKRSGKAWK